MTGNRDVEKLKKSFSLREIFCFVRGMDEKGKSKIIGIKILLVPSNTPFGKYAM
ncbi:MAG: hypothetical protein QXF52_02450 [Thermoproteota archaeon]